MTLFSVLTLTLGLLCGWCPEVGSKLQCLPDEATSLLVGLGKGSGHFYPEGEGWRRIKKFGYELVMRYSGRCKARGPELKSCLER